MSVELRVEQFHEFIDGKDVQPGDVVIGVDGPTEGHPYVRVYDGDSVTFQHLGSSDHCRSLAWRFRRLRSGEVLRITN